LAGSGSAAQGRGQPGGAWGGRADADVTGRADDGLDGGGAVLPLLQVAALGSGPLDHQGAVGGGLGGDGEQRPRRGVGGSGSAAEGAGVVVLELAAGAAGGGAGVAGAEEIRLQRPRDSGPRGADVGERDAYPGAVVDDGAVDLVAPPGRRSGIVLHVEYVW